MSAADHGSASTYVNHGCRCDACRAAATADQRRMRLNRIARRDSEDLRHGAATTYTNWGCRCEDCKAARAADMRRYRRQRKASR